MIKIHSLRGTGVFMWPGHIEGDSLYELAFDTTPFAFSLNGGSNWGKHMFMVHVYSGPGSCANFFMHKFAHLDKAATTCMFRHTVMSHARSNPSNIWICCFCVAWGYVACHKNGS